MDHHFPRILMHDRMDLGPTGLELDLYRDPSSCKFKAGQEMIQAFAWYKPIAQIQRGFKGAFLPNFSLLTSLIVCSDGIVWLHYNSLFMCIDWLIRIVMGGVKQETGNL